MKTDKKSHNNSRKLYCAEGQGRGSNLTQEDRRRGGEHSHRGSSSQDKNQGRGSNVSKEDQRPGGENPQSGRNS
jgi:hypothetical protein